MQRKKNTAPGPYRSFLLELAKNTPSCEIAQISDDEELLEILRDAAKGNIDITESVQSQTLTKMQMKAHILSRFITNFDVYPSEVGAVLLEFIETIVSPLTTVQPPETAAFLLNVNHEVYNLNVFSSLNQVYGLPHFKADSFLHRENRADTENSCRKKAKGHPSLSPGIFTLYCPHQVCYGFSVMRALELLLQFSVPCLVVHQGSLYMIMRVSFINIA